MRAVNLIPVDQQRGATGAAGRSGGAVYGLLGALALIVVMAAAWTLTSKSVDDKKAHLAEVNRQATQAEQRATALASYTTFASLREKRVTTVKQLANSRFDWSHALHEVARVMPTNAWLTQLTATTQPGMSIGGSAALRSALPVPAIEVAGCTTSQASVAKMMARMRLIDGVQQVTLQDSSKNDTASGQPAAGPGGDCRGGSAHFPQFTIIVFYQQQATVAANPAGATATAAAVGGSAPTTASSATPASTSTPSSSSPAPGGTTP